MLEPEHLDERRDFIVPGNKEETINYCVDHFISCYQQAVASRGFFAVALSGGSTPKAIFNKLSSKEYADKIAWENVLVFWSDERSVDPENPDSNFKMALDAGLKDHLLSENTFRMVAEENIKENALAYEQFIEEKLGKQLFDLVMLGMGDDGHTASLFPGTKALDQQDRFVVENHVPQKDTWRMTFTYTCINQSKQACFYVLGKNKQEMVKKILINKEDFPSSHIGTENHRALWILDDEAMGDEYLLKKARETLKRSD